MTVTLAERLSVRRADITTLDVDAVVNAANNALMPGGGVCGAIHRAAGRELAEACADVAPCPAGEARLTPAYAMRARWVIHAVGPVWRGGARGEEALLVSCYRAALSLAAEEGFESVAFPAISTGSYGYPLEAATRTALTTIADVLRRTARPARVICACFDDATYEQYERTLGELGL